MIGQKLTEILHFEFFIFIGFYLSMGFSIVTNVTKVCPWFPQRPGGPIPSIFQTDIAKQVPRSPYDRNF